MILAYLGMGLIGILSLVSFIVWLVNQGKQIARSEGLAKAEEKQNRYISDIPKIIQRSREYDDKIHEEYKRGPSADNLNKLFSDSDSSLRSVTDTGKAKGS